METIRGKQSLMMDRIMLTERLRGYEQILIDIGAGDGRFVRQVAQAHPNIFALGIDACRENLRRTSRLSPANALYVIANAYTLPCELYGLASHLAIHFPWGSLLNGLLAGDDALLGGLASLAQPGAHIELWLNGGALHEAGWPLDEGARRVQVNLSIAGFGLSAPRTMGAEDLRHLPTTWARRLAFGRDPRGIVMYGQWVGAAAPTQSLSCNGQSPRSVSPICKVCLVSYLLYALSGSNDDKRHLRRDTHLCSDCRIMGAHAESNAPRAVGSAFYEHQLPA